MDNFIKFLNQNNIKYTDEMLNKLDAYYNFLVEYNKNVNLTAITDKEEVYIKHFADSLLGLHFMPDNISVCDIGTGAGFPGVVLKIFKPSIKLYLVDSLQKRVIFLEKLIDKLQLDDVTVIHARAEDNTFKDKYMNYFDITTARAVANMATLVEYCLPFTRVNGKFIAYKSSGIDDELNNALHAISILGGELDYSITKNLNDDTERCFVVIKKVKKTDKKYPRSQNKPRTMPL